MVVSPDPEVGEVALGQGVEFLLESGASGLNGALAQASASLLTRQGQGMLAIPGDLPQLRLSSIRELVRLAAPRGVVIAGPARAWHECAAGDAA